MLNDTAFKPVAAWLAHVSSDMLFSDSQNHPAPVEAPRLGDVIHNAFAASHQLLEILRCLRVDLAAQGGGKGLNQYSSIVVGHLVMACHGLLLSIYVIVLIALQLDADLLLRATSDTDSSGFGFGSSAASPLADIRMVSVVHLCSYLVERQSEAVKQCLTPLSNSSPARSSHQQDPREPLSPGGLLGSAAPGLSFSMNCGQNMMSDLEMEVHQRLSRLRMILRI
jgi:hypothetical protein